MKIRSFYQSLFLGFAALVTAIPLQAQDREVALGANGELFRVRAGSYADLFPDANLATASNRVLGLDITHPQADGSTITQRLLVPGTGGNDVESTPSLFFEQSSKSIFLVWESRINALHSVLYLTSLSDGEFGALVQISGNRYSFKSSPQIAVSRDGFDLMDANGNPQHHIRTIVETVWWETTGAEDRAVYAPVVLIDGDYLGWNPVFLLDDLANVDTPRVLDVPTGPLLHTPSIHLGEGGAAVATFVNSETGRLNTLVVDVLPVDLSEIAARVRAKILTYPRIPSPVSILADAVRAHILDLGSNLHPSIRVFLADSTRANIIEVGSRLNPGQIRRLGDATRAQILDVGAGAFGGRGRLPNFAYLITEVMASPTAEPTVEEPGHALAHHVAVDLPIPDTGDAVPSIYTSPHGDSLIVSWEQDDKVLYRESTEDGWTDVLSISLGPNMTRAQAEQILAQRARNR